MKFRAFGNTLLVVEGRDSNQVGGIKIANTGRLKSGKVISIGALAMYYDGLEHRPDPIAIDDEVVYAAGNAVPFEFGDPNVVVIDIDDIVAVANPTKE